MGTQSFVFLKVSNMAKFPQKRGIPPERTARGKFLLTPAAETKKYVFSKFHVHIFQNENPLVISISLP